MSLARAATHRAEIRVDAGAAGDRQAWDRFVASHPDATVSHLYDWRVVIENAYGRPCFPLFAHRGEELRGVLPLAWMAGSLAGRRLVSMPFLDQGGLLARSEEDAAALWRSALGLGRRLGARGLELRGPPPGFLAGSGPTAAEHSPRARWILGLAGSREELWRRLSPKVRNQIRKASRLGLSTQHVGAEGLPRFYGVFARNMRDLGSPVHGAEFFRQILSVFGPRARLYVTTDAQCRTVAGAVALRFGDLVTVLWASALRASRPSCPNHSLYWRILRDAAARGARTFDFGRSSEGSGSARFKRQWGTVAEPLWWSSFDCDGRRASARDWSSGRHAVLVGAWRRLPLGLANRLGPVLRGWLPN